MADVPLLIKYIIKIGIPVRLSVGPTGDSALGPRRSAVGPRTQQRDTRGPVAPAPDETADIDLTDKLLFRPRGLVLEPFSSEEVGRGKTPDRRVLQGGHLVAFAEIKSPRDDWLDDQLREAPAGTLVGGTRFDSTFNRIARQVQKAARQFKAVNPSRDHPNILVLVNHADGACYRDLRETLTGEFEASTGQRLASMKNISDGSIANAKMETDLYVWISARDRRLEGYVFNQGAEPDHVARLCDLFGLERSSIRP
jgi:hypothetical protein